MLLSECWLCLHDVGDHVSCERWDDIKNPIDYPGAVLVRGRGQITMADVKWREERTYIIHHYTSHPVKKNGRLFRFTSSTDQLKILIQMKFGLISCLIICLSLDLRSCVWFGHYQVTDIGLEAGSVITDEQKLPIDGAGSLSEPLLYLTLTSMF